MEESVTAYNHAVEGVGAALLERYPSSRLPRIWIRNALAVHDSGRSSNDSSDEVSEIVSLLVEDGLWLVLFVPVIVKPGLTYTILRSVL